jgi:hypothetical protein
MSASYGQITLGGVTYLEKFWVYTSIFTLPANGFLQPRVILDGDGGFLLKYLEVQYSQSGGNPNYFRIKLGNSDGQQFYSGAGIVAGGGGNDRVHSALLLGNGQFPFPVIPYILFLPNGSINLDCQDISGNQNVVEMAFVGSKLYNQGNG